MRLIQRQGNLVQKVRDQRQRRTWLYVLEVRERLPVEQFHDQVWDLAAGGSGDTEIGDVHDIHVTQTSAGLRFALKACQEMGVSGPLRGDHLDRDHAGGPEVGGEIDISHTARTQLTVDAIFAIDDFADHGWPEYQKP